MNDNLTCRFCSGPLREGFLYVRNNDNPGFFNYAVWVEGSSADWLNVMKKRTAAQHPLVPYRCEQCGHIEFFAPQAEKWRG